MKALGIRQTKSQIVQTMKEIDKDGNGQIDFDEFKNLMHEKIS